jgi:biopolymer transport protein ExbD
MTTLPLHPRPRRRPLILLSGLSLFGVFLFALFSFSMISMPYGIKFSNPGPLIHLPATSSYACVRDAHTITIFLDAHYQFSVATSDSATQAAMIQQVARCHRIRFTPAQLQQLGHLQYLNQNVEQLPAWLSASVAERQQLRAGISATPDNDQLMEYVLAAQAASRQLFHKSAYIVLQIDQTVAAPRVMQLAQQLASHGIARYNLVGDYHDPDTARRHF